MLHYVTIITVTKKCYKKGNKKMTTNQRKEIFNILYRTINNVDFFIREDKIEELELYDLIINELGALRGIYYILEELKLTSPDLDKMVQKYWELSHDLLKDERQQQMDYYAKKQKEMKENE